MTSNPSAERPVGVYLVALYFVVAGFLESIQKYREWGGPLAWGPLAEQSVWALVADTLIFLVIAYLIWNFAWLGRLAALVWGYAMIATYAGVTILYLTDFPLSSSPLGRLVGAFHCLASVPLVWYLQPSRQKKLFSVSLVEILLSSD